MKYYFIDNPRIQLFFFSPNVCASFLLLCFFALLGAWLYFCQKFTLKKTIKKTIVASLLFTVIIATEILLAFTYSRGGFIALVFGISMVYFFTRNWRFAIFMVLFLLILAMIPSGIVRVGSMADIVEGSIWNRFLVWKGALCILADYCFFGTGIQRLGDIYTMWYQPLWLDERYITMVNDYLTIGSAFGIGMLFLYLVLCFFAIELSIKIWLQNKSVWILCLGAGCVSYLISACFSTLYRHWNVSGPFGITILIIIIFAIRQLYRKQLIISLRDVVMPCVIAAVLCGGLVICGKILQQSVPYSFKALCLTSKLEKKFEGWYGWPKRQQQAWILHFHDIDNYLDREQERYINRLLLSYGYNVLSVKVDSGLTGLERARALVHLLQVLNSNNWPVFLFGTDSGGKHAIVIAATEQISHLMGIISIDTPATWPFEELSPLQHINLLPCPILLISQNNLDDVETLKEQCIETGVSVTMEKLPSDVSGDNQNRKYERMIRLTHSFIHKSAKISNLKK